jgi:phage terminase small subunit
METYFGLKAKQREFVDAYIANGECGAEAMRACGFTGKRPDQKAWKLLQRDDIKAALQERTADLLRKAGVTAYRTLKEVTSLAFHKDPSATKLGALQLLMQHQKLITSKHEHTGKDGAPLPAPTSTVYIISKDEQNQISADLDKRV